MNDVLINLLTYALPSGFLVTFLNWIVSRRKQKARDMGELDTIYIENINRLREELIKTQDENRKVYRDVSKLERAVSKLERAINKATSCRHFDVCPVRDELSEQTNGHTDQRPIRHVGKHEKDRNHTGNVSTSAKGEA